MRLGTFQWMKSVNKSIILNKIRTDAPISRAQIAKDTKLTPPTVSSVVKELIEQGLVKESVLGESQGGRKPTMLLINNQGFSIIGIDAGPEMIECVLTDLSGKIMQRNSSMLTIPITNDQFLDTLKACIRNVLQASSSNTKDVIGIGVAMHGVVDVETGTSLFAPILGLKNIPIKEELEKEFDLTVKVENDARAMALGESWFGDHGELDSMLAVNIGHGVGAGLVVNGKLYHGAHDIAGEVGHMIIDLHGEICACGNRGCLQTFITGPAIAKRVTQRMSQNHEDFPHINGEKIYEFAERGNEDFLAILMETGRIIGIGLTNLIHIINPQRIVLGGGVTKSEKFILPVILNTIKMCALTPEAKQTEIRITRLGDDATLIGAVSLLLVDLFEPS
ncbi:ROK family transcriptional regulator [Psychrobacillus sp.]|uniref:ROK family transcriptional regulator n=1 Tax=Psychrobacillus sp. TaxID=1871623 RepID=UPI0028BEA198|nr:ROK family transcriptional regulator [Psychrobacillus sp.]